MKITDGTTLEIH